MRFFQPIYLTDRFFLFTITLYNPLVFQFKDIQISKDFVMTMNKAFFLRKEDKKPKWKVIDASNRVLGRLATEIADILRGKHLPVYTPHADAGDYVVIINAKAIVLTGKKWQDKIYDRYSGWMGGYKTTTAEQMQPARLIELAVERMLPKSKMGRAMIKKLKVYEGAEHPHKAQVAQ